jgi:glucose/arabinose dehydrogenase
MKQLLIAGIFLALAATRANSQINAGEQEPEPGLPFNMVQVATLDLPWKIAFLPDGRMLITEKVGALWLVTQQGAKTQVTNVPAVLCEGTRRHAGRLSLTTLCQGSQRLPYLFGAGRRRFEPGSCPGPSARIPRASRDSR